MLLHIRDYPGTPERNLGRGVEVLEKSSCTDYDVIMMLEFKLKGYF